MMRMTGAATILSDRTTSKTPASVTLRKRTGKDLTVVTVRVSAANLVFKTLKGAASVAALLFRQIADVGLVRLSTYVTWSAPYATSISTLPPSALSLPLSLRGPTLQYREGPPLHGIHQAVSQSLQTT